MYFRGIAADSKFLLKMKGYLFSEGYLFTGFYGRLLPSLGRQGQSAPCNIIARLSVCLLAP